MEQLAGFEKQVTLVGDTMPLSDENKKQILEQKLLQLEGEYYSLQIDHEVAEDLGNEQRMEQLQGNMADVKRATKKIEEKLEQFDG